MLVATVALGIYAAIILAIFKLFNITLTLPGIAGFVISTGMAVDANVLIFERMKEEMRRGLTLKMAVAEGFHRAWPSIWMSNVSTIDHLRHPLLVRKYIRRIHGEGVRHYSVPRCRHQFVQLRHDNQDIPDPTRE